MGCKLIYQYWKKLSKKKCWEKEKEKKNRQNTSKTTKKALSETKKYDRCISITHINRKYHKVIPTKPFFISTTITSTLSSLLFPFILSPTKKNKLFQYPYACSTSISNLKFLSLIQRYH